MNELTSYSIELVVIPGPDTLDQRNDKRLVSL